VTLLCGSFSFYYYLRLPKMKKIEGIPEDSISLAIVQLVNTSNLE